MELGDMAMMSIAQAIGDGPLQFCIPQWKNYVHNFDVLTGATTQVSVPIPAKYNSVKSIFTCLRSKADGGATLFLHASTTFRLSEYHMRLGSKVVPSKSPRNIPEFFTELLKAIGSVSDINHECMINTENYSELIPVANVETANSLRKTASSASFMIGIDLETYSNSDRSSIYAGYNTTTEDIFLQLRFDGTVGANQNVRSDSYSMYDAVLICENGTASVRF